MQKLSWRQLLPLLLWLVGLPAAPALAQGLTASADEVKAAYLYRFASYVEWPPGTFAAGNSPIVIGVMGSSAVLTELVKLSSGKSVAGRPVMARRVVPGEPPDGLHILFIARDAPTLPSAWIQRARESAALIVTEGSFGATYHAVLNFVEVRDRVRFEASLAAATQARLKLSSKLLSVAERVDASP